MLANNEKLAQIVAAKTTTVDDVIAALQNLDRELSNDDGLKWFNLLYLKVTEGVRHQSANMRWENVAWLERLRVLFAKLFLALWAYGDNDLSNRGRASLP